MTIVDDDRPANDDLARAAELSGSSGRVTGSNVGATRESGEPYHYGWTGGRSVWWRWTAPVSGAVVMDTEGSDFDTVLAVYEGSSYGQLRRLASDDDSGAGLTSRVTFAATQGAVYVIAVDGYGGSQGGIVLNWRTSEVPQVTVVASDGRAREGVAGDVLVFTVQRTEPLGQAVTVSWEVSGTARGGEDYVSLPSSVTLAAGEASARVEVTVLNDAVYEEEETVVVRLVSGSGYEVGWPSVARGVIESEDRPVNDDLAQAIVLSGSSGRVTGSNVGATRESGEPSWSGRSVWWRWTAPASGTLTVDTVGSNFDTVLGVYRGEEVSRLTALAVNDDAVGLQSRVQVGVEAGVSYVVMVDGYGGRMGSIVVNWSFSDRPVVTVRATRWQALEPGEGGGQDGEVEIVRTRPWESALTVSLVVGGTAVAGTDYEALPSSVTLAAGVESMRLTVKALGDAAVELWETVTVGIGEGEGYEVGSPSLATVWIGDASLSWPVVTLRVRDGLAVESAREVEPAVVVVERSGSTERALAVRLQKPTGTAGAGDYVGLPEVVELAAGVSRVEVEVRPVNDDAIEGTETVELALAGGEGYVVGVPSSARVYIIDDDVPVLPVVTLTVRDGQVGEPGDAGEVWIERRESVDEPLLVQLAVGGTATAGEDYEALPSEVFLPAGQASVSLQILPRDDQDAEGTETLLITLREGGDYLLGVPRQALIRISDDENRSPELLSPLNGSRFVAVSAQPWQLLVAGVDADGDSLRLELQGAPSWIDMQGLGARRWLLVGTPPTVTQPQSSVFALELVDGRGARDRSEVTVVVTAPAMVAVAQSGKPPVSTRRAPMYGAIAPGSRAGYEALNAAFRDLFPSRARGVWWQGGSYVDLPTLPPAPEYMGVFLATTVAREYQLPPAPRQGAPFVIPLLPSASEGRARWSFIGVPPLVVDGSAAGAETEHAWGDFRLEDENGVPVTDVGVIAQVLASGSGTDLAQRIRPWWWNGTSYERAERLLSGVAYWVPNFSTRGYRLVRTGVDDRRGCFHMLVGGSSLPARAARSGSEALASIPAREEPPAPPAGEPEASVASQPSGGSSGGGCGVGGWLGLMVLALLLLTGLRRRQQPLN
ncbi:MAG: hypothetical protein N3B15_09845 [Planctomycetota bacterium]|nr:hypothetical protein [Planctomycetota bacterium]